MYVPALHLDSGENENSQETKLRYDSPKKCRKWGKDHFFQIALEVVSPIFSIMEEKMHLRTIIFNLYVF